MKVTYEFDYYDERDELEKFQKSLDYHLVLYNVTSFIRDYYKHFEPSETEPMEIRYKSLKELLDRINSELEGYGIWES